MIAAASIPGSFCPRCGTPRTGDPASCPKCASTSFCPRCGKPAFGAPCACAVARAPDANLNTLAPVSSPFLGPITQVIVLYFAILGSIFVGPLLAPAGDNTSQTAVNADIAAGIALSSVALLAAILNARNMIPLMLRVGHWKWYALAPLGAVASFAMVSAVSFCLKHTVNLPSYNYSDDYLGSGYIWWLPFLMTAVQPGIFEELAFRGFINERLGRILEPREALIVTALLFATIHLNIISFAQLLVMGLALGELRRRCGSLYPCMIMHACHNGLVVLAELYSGASA